MYRELYNFQKLTGNYSFYLLEQIFATHYVLRCPKLLEDLERAGSLRDSIPEPALSILNTSLNLHCATKVVSVISPMRLGLIDVRMCIVKPVFIPK